MKITVLDTHAITGDDLSWDILHPFGEVTVYQDKAGEEETIRRIGDSEIVVSCKTLISRRVLNACKNIKMISVLSTGYDVVDIRYAEELGIPVCNIPTYATYSVAQFTIALLLELCHRIGEHSQSVHRGEWAKHSDFSYWLLPQTELYGKTLGIIGYGRIGQKVGEIAGALGMNVMVYSPHSELSVSLDEIYAKADVISLNCRLTEENRNIINAGTIAKMKDGVLIVNTARGGLINETDLKNALDSGKVGGAAVDVVSEEPILETNPLLSAKNCIISPHMAWAAKECRQRIVDITAGNIAAFIRGENSNQVNRLHSDAVTV